MTLQRARPLVSYSDPGGLEGLSWGTVRPMSGLQGNATLTATGPPGLVSAVQHLWAIRVPGTGSSWPGFHTAHATALGPWQRPLPPVSRGRARGSGDHPGEWPGGVPTLLQGWFQSTVGLDIGHLWSDSPCILFKRGLLLSSDRHPNRALAGPDLVAGGILTVGLMPHEGRTPVPWHSARDSGGICKINEQED